MRLLREDGSVVCDSCVLADTPLRRMKGLLGRSDLPRGEGLLIRPTSSIHMWFMKFPIDAVFLDGGLTVLRIRPDLRPWAMAGCRGAKAVLELPAGESERRGLQAGDRLILEAAPKGDK